MKETKVYVDELPESCSKCLFCYDNRPYWKSTDCIINHKELDEDEIEIKREKDCPLIDIKTHDRALVKEVCEKIIYNLGSIEDIIINLGNGKEDAFSYFIKILNKVQKEFEDENNKN